MLTSSIQSTSWARDREPGFQERTRHLSIGLFQAIDGERNQRREVEQRSQVRLVFV
jgi:hypothetical protein